MSQSVRDSLIDAAQLRTFWGGDFFNWTVEASLLGDRARSWMATANVDGAASAATRAARAAFRACPGLRG